MSYFLPRLESGWHADQAILAEDNRVVVIRFGHDWVLLPFISRAFSVVSVDWRISMGGAVLEYGGVRR